MWIHSDLVCFLPGNILQVIRAKFSQLDPVMSHIKSARWRPYFLITIFWPQNKPMVIHKTCNSEAFDPHETLRKLPIGKPTSYLCIVMSDERTRLAETDHMIPSALPWPRNSVSFKSFPVNAIIEKCSKICKISSQNGLPWVEESYLANSNAGKRSRHVGNRSLLVNNRQNWRTMS